MRFFSYWKLSFTIAGLFVSSLFSEDFTIEGPSPFLHITEAKAGYFPEPVSDHSQTCSFTTDSIFSTITVQLLSNLPKGVSLEVGFDSPSRRRQKIFTNKNVDVSDGREKVLVTNVFKGKYDNVGITYTLKVEKDVQVILPQNIQLSFKLKTKR